MSLTQEKPSQERIDHYRPQGEEFDKAYTYDYKPRTDETEVSQEQVTAEKITVSQTEDICRMEETEKPRYPKHLDVGRIVIEETPEEKQEVIRRDIVKRDEVVAKHKDREARYEVKRQQQQKTKEDVVKMGRLEITDLESRKIEKTPWEKTETVERPRKACEKYLQGENSHND